MAADFELGRARGYLAGHTITTAHYVATKALGRIGALAGIVDLLRLFEIVPVDKSDFEHALTLPVLDYEDAVQVVCAAKVGADFIVTRDAKDFAGAATPVLAPSAVLALL